MSALSINHTSTVEPSAQPEPGSLAAEAAELERELARWKEVGSGETEGYDDTAPEDEAMFSDMDDDDDELGIYPYK